MANATKKLTAGLLMAATTFTVGSTCFANQVGFFNDGTGCEISRCYRDLRIDISSANGVLRAKIGKNKLAYEDDLMKKYYPEVFEKVDSAHKAIIECADDDCVRQNFEKIYNAARQYKKEAKDYLINFNDENRSELAERGLANEAIYHKSFWGTLWQALNKNRKFDTEHESKLWSEFCDNKFEEGLDFDYAGDFKNYIESQKAIYDYYKQTAAELGFDTSVSHKDLIVQLKECESDDECDNAKWEIKLPTNNVLETQNFYCAEPNAEPVVEQGAESVTEFDLTSCILLGTVLGVAISGARYAIVEFAGVMNPVLAAVVGAIWMPIVLPIVLPFFISYEFVKIGAKYKI